jgi:hypothetical protein
MVQGIHANKIVVAVRLKSSASLSLNSHRKAHHEGCTPIHIGNSPNRESAVDRSTPSRASSHHYKEEGCSSTSIKERPEQNALVQGPVIFLMQHPDDLSPELDVLLSDRDQLECISERIYAMRRLKAS